MNVSYDINKSKVDFRSETFLSKHLPEANLLGHLYPKISYSVCEIFSKFKKIIESAFYYLHQNASSTSTLTQGMTLKVEVQKLRLEGKPHWQEQARHLISKSYQDKPEKELQRLRGVDALTKSREVMLDESLGKVHSSQNKTQKMHAKVLFGQALEIKDLYKGTHHVFIHAQATKWVVLTYLLKELIRKTHPEIDIHNFKFLRSPGDPLPKGFLNQVWSQMSTIWGANKTYDNVQSYVSSKWFPVCDSLTAVRKDLISVDGYFYNYASCESSMYFLVNNSNITNSMKDIEKFSREYIQYFVPSISQEKLKTLSHKIVSAFSPKSDPCGNLFVLCFPKGESEKIQYRAHSYGPPCQCHANKSNTQILEKLQNEEFDKTTKCSSTFSVPQFRVYTPLLKPGGGKRIYLLTPFAKNRRKAIKANIKKIVEEVLPLVS